jgi:ribosomal protein S18 acetylase RimI-like enzyme
MIEYKVERAGEEDLQLVHNMAEIVFRHTYREILSPEQMEYMMDWMYSMPSLRRQIEDGHVYHIAWKDGVPCGYVSVQPEGRTENGRMLFHLQKIYVLPSEQGSGLGRLLFDTALDHMRREAGGRPASLELNVNRNNPAIGFYQHLGMKILRQGDFHIGNGFYMNDFIMGIDIE